MQFLSYLQLAHSLSRRDFTQMLRDEVMKVNDEPVKTYQHPVKIWDHIYTVLPSGVTLDLVIEELPKIKPVLVLFHKPKWVVVSKDDPHNKTIYELLPDSWKDDFYYIWRLDKDSTWLLMLTNDPSLVDKYENPRNNVHKVYELIIDKPLRTAHQIKMRKWVRVTQKWETVTDRVDQEEAEEAELLSCESVHYQNKNDIYKVSITLSEGKKRHIRRLFRALWYKVVELRRLKVGLRWLWTIKKWERRIVKEVKRTKSKSKPKNLSGIKKKKLKHKLLDKNPKKKKKKNRGAHTNREKRIKKEA